MASMYMTEHSKKMAVLGAGMVISGYVLSIMDANLSAKKINQQKLRAHKHKHVLAKALKLADPAVVDKIRGAMGMNVKRELDEVIELIPKMRAKDIEDEQRKVLKEGKEMIYSGQIGSPAAEEEELV